MHLAVEKYLHALGLAVRPHRAGLNCGEYPWRFHLRCIPDMLILKQFEQRNVNSHR
jgi:hypothetical protein